MFAELGRTVGGYRSCLAHLKTTKFRRRDTEDEDVFEMHDPFLSDGARILSSKAFRLLGDKTQVFTGLKKPFIRKRHTHVMEVTAIAMVVADMLGLNTSLAQAIALGHDIGHVPFGHPGEHHLRKLMGKPEFCHEILGPLMMQKIERKGRGLNLTFETLDGMMRHSGDKAKKGMTPEAWVVRYVDKMAYLFADFNDLSERVGHYIHSSLKLLMNSFGRNQRERTTTAMSGLIIESAEQGKVSFELSDLGQKFAELRREMNTHYVKVTEQDLSLSIDPIIKFLEGLGRGDPFLLFCLLTDADVKMLLKKRARNIIHLQDTALWERLPLLENIGQIDLCNPYLDW